MDNNIKSSLKIITPTTLYNLTQDNLHLIILDFRNLEAYLRGFIRRSYRLDATDDSLQVIHELFTYIEKISSNYDESIKKYNLPKTRRLVVITESSSCSLDDALSYLEKSSILEQFERRYAINNCFDVFQQKYPFLVLSLPDSAKHLTTEQRQEYLTTKCTDQLLYANSQFPLEIIEGKLFLGSNFNKFSSKQRNDLHIEYTVEVKSSEEVHNELSIDEEKKDLLVTFDIQKMIDFDTLIKEINDKVGDSCILVCGAKLEITAGWVIAMLMKNAKIDINSASLRVFTKVGNTIVDRTLYNHLIHYTPGKIVFKKFG